MKRAVTLSVSLTPEMAAEIQRRVRSGMYGSASELVRDALRHLLQSEATPGPDLPKHGDHRLHQLLRERETAPDLVYSEERLRALRIEEPETDEPGRPGR